MEIPSIYIGRSLAPRTTSMESGKSGLVFTYCKSVSLSPFPTDQRGLLVAFLEDLMVSGFE